MNIEQMRYSVEVAKVGSISIASENLYVSQSAISQSIMSLEEELGMSIFIRSRYGTRPTNEGKEVIQRAAEILEKLQEIKQVAQSHTRSMTGQLRLAVCPGTIPFILNVLQFFKHEYPDVEITIEEKGCHEIIADLQQDRIDIGFVLTAG